VFVNNVETRAGFRRDVFDILGEAWCGDQLRTPASPPPMHVIEPSRLADSPAAGLRVTWFGHSSVLVEIDGYRVLTDPVWSARVTPVNGIGPQRFGGDTGLFDGFTEIGGREGPFDVAL